MSNLTFFKRDFEGSEVRVTEDRRFSVFDVLTFFVEPTTRKGKKADSINPRQVWASLQGSHSELVQLVDNFKFPGRGQRETPVANEEGIIQILMVIPGSRGAAFREWAAGIIADPEKALDHAVNKYRNQGKSYEWIEARLKGKVERRKLTDVLKAHGVKGYGYAQCTDAMNTALFGNTAKQLQEARGVKLTRDGLDDVEVAALGLSEALARRDITTKNYQGNHQCADACNDAGSRVRKALD